MPPDHEPTSNHVPASIVDPVAEKVTEGKQLRFILELLAYCIVIVSLVILYIYFNISKNVEYYLLFHVLAELFSIVILGSIFIVGWNTRHFVHNSFFLVLGVSSLFVAVLDLFHMLAFPGMGFFTEVYPEINSNLAPQIWIAARYFQSISLIIAILVMRKKIKPFKVIAITFTSFALVFLAIFTRAFPMAHNGTSLTLFKIASEYVIVGLFGLSGLLTWRERTFFGKRTNRLLLAYLSSLVVSELLFTLYMGSYEFPNMLGHLFKIVAFVFAYKAIVQSSLDEPLQGIFKKLVETDRDLEKRNQELVMYTSKLQQEIAERKKAEGILRQFVSTLSHEIRTPATVLDQSVQTFVKYNERMSTEQETALIGAISRNMGIMSDLVENVQDLTRIDDHKVQLDVAPVDFKAIIIDVVKVMGNSIRAKDMHMDVSVDDGISFSGDTRKITHITRALVDNAVKFSPRGSKFSIVVKDRYNGEFNKDGQDGLLLQVADNGMGIDADLLPRLYERFARSARVQDIPGSGLGLAITKEFVAMHGGKIYVATQVDKGTTFSVFLPRRNLDYTHGLNRGE